MSSRRYQAHRESDASVAVGYAILACVLAMGLGLGYLLASVVGL